MKKLSIGLVLGLIIVTPVLAAKQYNESSKDSDQYASCGLKANSDVYTKIMKEIKAIDVPKKVLLAYGKKGGNSNEVNFNGCIDNTKKITTLTAVENLNLKKQFSEVELKLKSVFGSISLTDLALETEYCSTKSNISIIGEKANSSDKNFIWRPSNKSNKKKILIKEDSKIAQNDKMKVTWELVSQLLHAITPGKSYNVRQAQIDIILESLKEMDSKDESEITNLRDVAQAINFPSDQVR
jgi:hypothetical protein